ncbi:MAG: bifunctional precorrin-2 dehydrogenase/sirohydrochlorin ferrochelatase [Candidatus Omnitrophota bacterium]|nr:bifunctional precorrin-2 dehydrogenase/sirohydrochlorin ferrochelatase [Candidatus Omnitrophota bacterium]
MPKYYPINLNLEGKKCVVVGAGSVAERKVRRLLECGARVEVVAPVATRRLEKLARAGKITLKKKHISLRDIDNSFLVISATGDRRINNLVSRYCQENRILVNVADSPYECNFTLPSIIKRGDLLIGISTSGASPALAKKIRKDLEKIFGKEYAAFLSLMKRLRPKVIAKIENLNTRKKFFEKAVSRGIIQLLKRGKEKQVKGKLEQMLKNVR